ncbi:MAG: TIR domain-containing protein [Candidatus Contendobacter sp.]|nr:TIR domain-containing protein [Candidatus Contendobacter sp.]MDS4059749.1 TIR domain-containing protein [Candidatus Contendobacter sp.]
MAATSLFICHARPDAAFAEDLAVALETCRLNVWRDTRNRRGGDQLALEVRWAIEQARQVLVVLSLNTGEAGWMRREIELAQEMERRRANTYRVIPLLLPGVDSTLLGSWFTPPPQTPPIQLPADGLGAVLSTLLAALGESPPSDAVVELGPPPLAELELVLGRATVSRANSWPITAHLNCRPEPASISNIHLTLGPLPRPIDPDLPRWYLRDHLVWPTDTVRQLAQRVSAWLEAWGQALYQATLGSPAMTALTAEWHQAPDPSQRRLTLRTDNPDPAAAALLDLPWELLSDNAGFLLRGKQPVQFQRRLAGGGEAFPPAPPPLRILTLSPRPDTEPTGQPDYRRAALPLLEALEGLGALVEVQVLTPPTLAALEKQLNDAWSAGRPFIAVHLDGRFRHDPEESVPLFGFEASYDLHVPLCRNAQFVSVTALATLLATYRIRLVVLIRPEETTRSIRPAQLASAFLAAGIAAVIAVHPDAPTETLRRFWTAFHEELLRGARISQALFAGQRRLASDSYRGPGLGGGDVYLQDWFAFTVYLGQHDPRLTLRPALELWRRLAGQSRSIAVGSMPSLPSNGYLARTRELLIAERLLENQSTVFIKGPGGSGKTTLAADLVGWLARTNRYRYSAYVHADNAGNPRALLETLGRQLLPVGGHWTVGQYPTQWQALDHLRQTLRPIPILLVLDQIECWPAEHDEAFDQFWKDLMSEWPTLHLLALGRAGPPSFAQPWAEIKLVALDETDAIALLGQMLIAAGEAPPSTDNGASFQQLRELVAMVGCHPGALLRLAPGVGVQGVSAILTLLRPLQADLLRRHGDDLQWPLYLGLELELRRLSASDRDLLAVLAFFKDGVHRIALGHALELDTLATQTFCARLIALGLAEDRGHGHLRFDPALARYLFGQLDLNARATWRERWRNGMEQFLAELYQQHFKDSVRAKRLLRLELPNLLALLRDNQQGISTERIARIATQMEQLLASLGIATALDEAKAARERASQALRGWSRARFETERLRIERLRDNEALEEALQAARQLLRQCQEAGTDAYPGAAYDQARAHFQLGKLLKMASAAEPAARELNEARQRFQALADAGNVSAARMAAVAGAETGDCLSYLRRLQDAAAAYEAALAHIAPGTIHPMVAANQLQLGLVRQRQGRYFEAATLYNAARQAFESLGEPEEAAQAWRQLGLARKLLGEIEPALKACQQALYLYEQLRNRAGIAEVLGELGHLHHVLNQLEEAVLAYRRMADLYAELGDGRGEEASRNKLANVLIQLRRHDEARQELYRASECNLPESLTARNWAIRRGLRDVGQAVENPGVADEARRQSIQKYLAYRRAGGDNANPGSRLCAQIGQAIRAGDTAPLAAKLAQIVASPNVPPAGKLLITKLQAILAGSRDPALATDPDLHYQYAADIQLLLDDLAKP